MAKQIRTNEMNVDWYDKALVHRDQENYSQAIICIDQYIEKNPESKNGKLLKAVIYGDLSYYKMVLEILADISPSTEDTKKYSKVYYIELGDTYKEMGKFDEALKWYDKAIQIAPNETGGYIMKGACLASIGQYEKAKTEHKTATRLEGDPEEAYYNLALIARAELKLDDAREYCEKSLKIDPEDVKVRHCHKDVMQAITLKERLKSPFSN